MHKPWDPAAEGHQNDHIYSPSTSPHTNNEKTLLLPLILARPCSSAG